MTFLVQMKLFQIRVVPHCSLGIGVSTRKAKESKLIFYIGGQQSGIIAAIIKVRFWNTHYEFIGLKYNLITQLTELKSASAECIHISYHKP